MAESEWGRIEVKEDFNGLDDPVANTAVPRFFNPHFRIVGQGIAEADSGVVNQNTPNGVVRLTTTNEADHCCGLETFRIFDVALNGTLVAEARIKQEALTSRESWFGFTDIDIASQVPSIQTDLAHIGTATVTLTASDLVGFLLSSEATDSADWHGIYNGGTATGETDSTAVDLDADAVAGEFQILRIEVAPNGTARWYVDGELKQTVENAVSTTVNLKLWLATEAKSTTIAELDVDYIKYNLNRDWTV